MRKAASKKRVVWRERIVVMVGETKEQRRNSISNVRNLITWCRSLNGLGAFLFGQLPAAGSVQLSIRLMTFLTLSRLSNRKIYLVSFFFISIFLIELICNHLAKWQHWATLVHTNDVVIPCLSPHLGMWAGFVKILIDLLLAPSFSMQDYLETLASTVGYNGNASTFSSGHWSYVGTLKKTAYHMLSNTTGAASPATHKRCHHRNPPQTPNRNAEYLEGIDCSFRHNVKTDPSCLSGKTSLIHSLAGELSFDIYVVSLLSKGWEYIDQCC